MNYVKVPGRLLDTNICIYLIRQRSPAALRRFEEFEVGEVGLSVVTVSELRYGVEKSARPEQNGRALEQFLSPWRYWTSMERRLVVMVVSGPRSRKKVRR